MMKYLLISLCFSFSTIKPASETAPVQCQRHSGLREMIAQNYYQNASVVGHGTTSRSIHLFLNDQLSKDETFKRSQLEDTSYRYTFFHRATKEGKTEIVLLPFEHKVTGYFQDTTLDKEAKIPLYPYQSAQAQTITVLKMLHGHFENTLVCHFVSHESPRLPTETPALTRLGAVVFKIFPPNNSGHLTYMHLEFDGHTQQATLFDPVSLTVESRYLLHPHQDKAARYQGITLFDMPLNIQHVYRADQCYNEHDCGRFSAIYLLYALSGKNISDLSRDEIYQGFKRWITGPRGLLSYQKVHDKKAGTKLQKAIENKSADLAQESEKVMEAIRRESDDIMLQFRTNFSEQQALQDELTLKNKQFDEEIEKLKVEQNYESAFKKKEERKEMNEIFYQKFKVLATKGDDVTKLFAAITAKTNQCSETFTQTSLAALAPLSEQLMRESAAREQRAHLMKKTCFATFTTPWRTVVDWILRYL